MQQCQVALFSEQTDHTSTMPRCQAVVDRIRKLICFYDCFSVGPEGSFGEAQRVGRRTERTRKRVGLARPQTPPFSEPESLPWPPVPGTWQNFQPQNTLDPEKSLHRPINLKRGISFSCRSLLGIYAEWTRTNLYDIERYARFPF